MEDLLWSHDLGVDILYVRILLTLIEDERDIPEHSATTANHTGNAREGGGIAARIYINRRKDGGDMTAYPSSSPSASDMFPSSKSSS